MATTTQDLIRDAVITALDDALNDKNNFMPKFIAEKFSDMNERDKQLFIKVFIDSLGQKEKEFLLETLNKEDVNVVSNG